MIKKRASIFLLALLPAAFGPPAAAGSEPVPPAPSVITTPTTAGYESQEVAEWVEVFLVNDGNELVGTNALAFDAEITEDDIPAAGNEPGIVQPSNPLAPIPLPTETSQPVTPTDPAKPELIVANDPVKHLNWGGNESVTYETSIIGDRLLSPGDRIERKISLMSDAPEDGILSIEIIGSQIVRPANPDLADDVMLSWDSGKDSRFSGEISFADLIKDGGTREIVNEKITPGQAFATTLLVQLGDEVADHRPLAADEATEIKLKVRATLSRDKEAPTTQTPEKPVDSKKPEQPTTQATGKQVRKTGLTNTGAPTSAVWIALILVLSAAAIGSHQWWLRFTSRKII